MSSPAHLLATFFTPVRATTRRNIIGLAAKHALLELPGPGGIADDELARRMGLALETFAERDRAAVADALVPLQARLRVLDGGKLLRAATRLGELDEFWDIIDDPLAAQMDGLVTTLSPEEWKEWPVPGGAGVLALVRVDRARERLPSLQRQFDRLGRLHWAKSWRTDRIPSSPSTYRTSCVRRHPSDTPNPRPSPPSYHTDRS